MASGLRSNRTAGASPKSGWQASTVQTLLRLRAFADPSRDLQPGRRIAGSSLLTHAPAENHRCIRFGPKRMLNLSALRLAMRISFRPGRPTADTFTLSRTGPVGPRSGAARGGRFGGPNLAEI